MRRALALALLAGVLAGAVSASAAPRASAFPFGVAAGEVTATSAMLWTKAPRAGPVAWEVLGPDGRVASGTVRARPANDDTVTVTVRRLAPGVRYGYRFTQGTAKSPPGRFTTAFAPTADAKVRFAVSGDADATPGSDGKPGFNRFETYAAMARERNDFNINLGDTIYSDSEVAGAKPALTVSAKWGKYRQGLALPALRSLRAAAGLYSHPDDHEFVNDFSVPEHGVKLYSAGVRAFRDYAPVSWSRARGFYRTFRWGRHVQLFFLDERSFRSADVASQCRNDWAPTAPPGVRARFGTVAPTLARPVPQACLDALASPTRTLLGSAQRTAFLRDVRRSTATWKVILNEVPLMQLYALPYDRWEGYASDRTRVLDGLRGVDNVVVLTTDTHAHLIGEVRRRTLEGPTPVGTGIWEVVTGPVATSSYARKLEAFLGIPGAVTFVTGLFFKPEPPRGLGLRCVRTDVNGYAQVVASADTLTVTPKDATGARVTEAGGAPCGPLVLRAR